MALRVLLLLALVGCAFAVGVLVAVLRRRRETDAQRRRRHAQEAFGRVLQTVRSESEAITVLDGYLRSDVPGARFVFLRVDEAGQLHDDCIALRSGEGHAEDDPSTLIRCDVCREAKTTLCVPAVARGRRVGVLRVAGRTLTPDERDVVAATVRYAAPAIENVRSRAHDELRALADELTGLPNRRGVSDGLGRMVAEAARSGIPLSLLLVDLDGFAQVNERQGIQGGDKLLAAVARGLVAATRASDLVGRHGGEEFTLLLHDTDGRGAAVVAENILRVVRELGRELGADGLTASVGMATYPQDAPDASELFRAADHALSRAKAEGSDRAEAF